MSTDGRAMSANTQRGGHPAGAFIVVGALFLVLFVIGFMLQIQTNEAFISQSGKVVSLIPNWEVLMQPINLVLGRMPASEAPPTFFGWAVEVFYLGLILGHDHMKHAVTRSGKLLSDIFQTLAYGLIAFNGWTDFNYGAIGGDPFWGHLMFSAAVSASVAFAGVIGMRFLEIGWKRA